MYFIRAWEAKKNRITAWLCHSRDSQSTVPGPHQVTFGDLSEGDCTVSSTGM